MGFLRGSVVKNLPANAGDAGLIPGSGRSLEKDLATHSSILAWRIPGTEEPGGLPSMGSHRIGHDCSDLAAEAEETFETRSLCHRGSHMLSSQAWALSLRQASSAS